MKIAVLGTGSVGQALAGRLLELGHDVVIGTRDPEATRGRGESFGPWLEAHPGARLACGVPVVSSRGSASWLYGTQTSLSVVAIDRSVCYLPGEG